MSSASFFLKGNFLLHNYKGHYLTTVHPFAVAIAGVHVGEPVHRFTLIVFPDTVGNAVNILFISAADKFK